MPAGLAFACPARTKLAVHVKDPMSTCQSEKLVNWCFEPSQPIRIISGLKETFIKRHIVERTNKAEIRSEEQSEKTAEQLLVWTHIYLIEKKKCLE